MSTDTPPRVSLPRLTATLVALAGLALATSPGTARAQDVGLPLGTKPAAVKIQNLQGGTVDLARYVGAQPVLLEFWATWCPICKALEPRMKVAFRKYGHDVRFLRVAVAVAETPSSIRRRLRGHPIAGTVLWDLDGRATRAYDAPTTSYVVILNKAGKVTYTGTGSDQNLDAALAKVVGS